MHRKLIVRAFGCAALAGSVLAVAVPGAIASAKPVKLVCTGFSGSATTQYLSGCTPTASIGAAGTGTSDVASNTVTWANGSTSIESYTYTELTGKKDKCPVPAGDTAVAEIKEAGTITGGTNTALTGGKIKGQVCVNSNASGIVVSNFPGKSQDL